MKDSGINFTKKSKNKITGNIGELKAVLFLKNMGYEILEQNFKTKIGEIDIIAKDDERIVFVEVKARATARYGYPRESVTKKKQQTIRRVAEIYLLKNHKTNVYCRFDVVEIYAPQGVDTQKPKIHHLEDAFQ